MKMFVRYLLLTASAVCICIMASAQDFAVKTNALYWVSTTPNIGFEVGLGKKTTLDISAGYNPWTLDKSGEDNMKFKHVKVDPEFRYWFCERFHGHFIGVNALYSYYNVSKIAIPFVNGSRDNRYQGWSAGAGITYGYSWVIGRRWNIEANIGVGYLYTAYDRYQNRTCGLFCNSANRHLFGLTDLGVSFIYMIR